MNDSNIKPLPNLEKQKEESQDNRRETTMTAEEAVYTHKLIDLKGCVGDASESIGYSRGSVSFALSKDKIPLRMETASRLAYENAMFQLKASARFFVVEANDMIAEHLIPWVQNSGGKIREVDVIAAESE